MLATDIQWCLPHINPILCSIIVWQPLVLGSFNCQLDTVWTHLMQASIEELLRSYWPVGMSKRIVLMWENSSHCGWHRSWAGDLGLYKKVSQARSKEQARQECSSMGSASSSSSECLKGWTVSKMCRWNERWSWSEHLTMATAEKLMCCSLQGPTMMWGNSENEDTG